MIHSYNIQTELLAPARNTEFGIAAINHGADAVYIGTPKFSARNSASNSISEIEQLIKYAHLFKVRVYAALNTILYDNEIEEAVKIINQLYQSGIDGIILQDLGLLKCDLPPVPLIASTQTHNITSERVQFLEKCGFKRVILGRELGLTEISEIRNQTSIELESFIHGAICVSYSGQCYLSEIVCGRSGNRGICAQPCRSLYNIVDENKQILVKNKHVLSQKDLNLSAYIEDLLNVGVTSFKIEGRLKDLSYVKNITSWYRKLLDAIIEKNQKYCQSSSGKCYHFFNPDPERSFNRGFTSYFINGRKEKTGQPDTQKSIGKQIGYVTAKGTNWISLDYEGVSNGDGICFFGNDSKLYGTSINKVIGKKIFLNNIDNIDIGFEVYRNHDQQFEKNLLGKCAERKIPIDFYFSENEKGFVLKAEDMDGTTVLVECNSEKIPAKNPELAKDTIRNQLSRLGESVFELSDIKIDLSEVYFLPISLLNELRRKVIDDIGKKRIAAYKPESIIRTDEKQNLITKKISYSENISNSFARDFFISMGAEEIEPALELLADRKNKVVMTSRYCIRYQYDACPIFQKNKVKWNNPLYLQDQNHLFKLDFNCKKCEMNVIFIQ